MERWYDLFNRRLTRRDFIHAGRDLTACLALGSLSAPACGRSRLRSNPFTLGVGSGDPLSNGVVLWTRLDPSSVQRSPSVSLRWEVSEDERFTRVVRSGTSLALPELGYSVHAEATGLGPSRDYWYRFITGGHVSTIGRTRTAAAPGASLEKLRFAFASCQNYEHGYYTAFRHLASDDLDFVVHLGDYIYEKRFSLPELVREHEAGEVFTLDQYRARYARYRSDADLQAAHAVCPWIVTWDDHEVSNNYAGAVPEGAVAPELFLLRRAAAYQAYYEFMPLRRSSLPARPSMQIFRRLGFGGLARFHVLDTRQYRWDQACGDGRKLRCPDALAVDRTMLGPAQERWLAEGLRTSSARWNVLANQVMLAQTREIVNNEPTFAMDRWDGYVAAQDRLLELLYGTRQSNQIVITGDIHSNWVADLKRKFEEPNSPIIGTEFAGTSISSGGDGIEGSVERLQADNPHIKFYNSRRGYVRVVVTPSLWTTEYRVVPYVSRPGAPIETRATFVVENGNPGAQTG